MQKNDILLPISTSVRFSHRSTRRIAGRWGTVRRPAAFGKGRRFSRGAASRGPAATAPHAGAAPARGVFQGTYRTVANCNPRNPIVVCRAIRISCGIPVTTS
ncbi:hypothetical protein SQ03_13640 [Methylobacterium platani JCM 14648]|uniref:Uncharacterized protein n=1 Tax=Methylobacterium platani JCM 14648 TaxID=1295136 RepID=A0ABR5H1I7_9HYPH|nr:hypothetical protein SQ03_13640 [Methylobacterium platani JCM 14648]